MKVFKKLENMFAATAFTEAGEFYTAREMANEPVDEKQPAAKQEQHKTGNRGSGIHLSSTRA